MGFQLHLLFGVKEVLFFQFPKDPPLSLRERDRTGGSHGGQSAASAVWLREWGASSCTPSPGSRAQAWGLLPPPPKTALTLNWASGGPVMMTILSLTSGPSAGAICRSRKGQCCCSAAPPAPLSSQQTAHTPARGFRASTLVSSHPCLHSGAQEVPGCLAAQGELAAGQ